MTSRFRGDQHHAAVHLTVAGWRGFDVQSAISAVQRRLPRNCPPPSFRKTNPADDPILIIARVHPLFRCPTSTNTERINLSTHLAVSGVAQVTVLDTEKCGAASSTLELASAHRHR